MAEAKVAPRPLSPHLQIYRWSWTMAMSVAHRIYQRHGFQRLSERDWEPHPGIRLIAFRKDLAA